MGSNDAVVLIVDDDPQIRSVFSGYLADEFEVRTAESGHAALEAMGDDVDAVLLDRRMPEMSGEETLAELREAGYDQPVAMVTAVEPDFDVLEMGFDNYVVKPVYEEELQSIVETLLLRREFDEVIREYVALVSKVTALHRGKSEAELDENAAYEDSVARIEEIKAEARKALDVAIETGKFDEIVRELEGGGFDLDVGSSGGRPFEARSTREEDPAGEGGSADDGPAEELEMPDWRSPAEPAEEAGTSPEEEPRGESTEGEEPGVGSAEEENHDEETRSPDS